MELEIRNSEQFYIEECSLDEIIECLEIVNSFSEIPEEMVAFYFPNKNSSVKIKVTNIDDIENIRTFINSKIAVVASSSVPPTWWTKIRMSF